KRGGMHWSSSQKGKLTKYADKVLNSASMMKNFRVLTDEKIELPERYPSSLSEKLKSINQLGGTERAGP
ncbi:hypothetical protein Ahia01_000839200, partial [Argonauta hians]